MRIVCVRWALVLAAIVAPSMLRAADEEDAQQRQSAPASKNDSARNNAEAETKPTDSGAATPEVKDDVEAKPASGQTFVVTCKLVQPKQRAGWREPGLVVATVAANESTKIPVRLKIEDFSGFGFAEMDELRFAVPGTDDAESIAVGHQIQVKVMPAGPRRVRLDAAVDFRDVERTGDELRLAGHSGRYVGELATGKPAQVVLATDDLGQPKHWVEFVVRVAGEELDESDAASRSYPVVYSVAGLVRVNPRVKPGKRPELDFAPLIEKIEAQVSPDSWADAGGEGKIQSFARNASLVVTQTAAVHQELAVYLKRLLDDEDAIQTALEQQ